MIPILPTQEIGSIRKPEYLLKVFRRYIKGEAGEDELKPAVERASLETIRMLEDAGLDIVWDGEMHRWEMYYHPVRFIDGIEFAGQVRVWDNLYFIKGRVISPPKLIRNYHREEVEYILSNARRPVKVPVTGPYTIADWSFNEYYLDKWSRRLGRGYRARYEAKRELTIQLAREVLNPLLREISRLEIFRIQIDEPAATTHPDEMPIFVEAFNEAVKGVEKEVSTHICYSDYRILLPYIHDINTVQFTLEFANRDSRERGVDDDSRPGYSLLKELVDYGYDKELGLGVVDVHTDFIEPVELIADRIRYALKYIPPERLYINPDCGLRTRSRDIAYRKLRNMVEAVKIVRRELGYGD